jgi:nucleotide-binding universal stress UspA family protein
LDDALSEAFSGEPPVEIERRLVEGHAGEALKRESASADLVVVGSRGRSALAAALLGSVSEHVVGHAACPVVVVKSRREG